MLETNEPRSEAIARVKTASRFHFPTSQKRQRNWILLLLEKFMIVLVGRYNLVDNPEHRNAEGFAGYSQSFKFHLKPGLGFKIFRNGFSAQLLWAW